MNKSYFRPTLFIVGTVDLMFSFPMMLPAAPPVLGSYHDRPEPLPDAAEWVPCAKALLGRLGFPTVVAVIGMDIWKD